MPTDPTESLAHLPFPVAYPLAHAQDASLDVGHRLDNTVFAAYQAMRTAGLLMLADYLREETSSPRVANAVRGLRLPHWKEWSDLCDRLAAFYASEDLVQPVQPATFGIVVEGWRAVNRRGALPKTHEWAALLSGLPGMNGAAQSLNDAIWKARNDRAHRQGTRVAGAAEDKDRLRRLQPVVEMLVERLFPPGSVELLRRAPVEGHLFRLHGDHRHAADAAPEFLAEPIPPMLAGPLAESEVIAVADGVAVPLYPLVIAADPETGSHALGGGGFIEHVALVDGASDKKVTLLGVQRHFESARLATALMSAFRRKQVDFGLDREATTRWALADWASMTAQTTLDELRGRKYFPECYVTRTGIEDRIEGLLDHPGRALLLLGEAGSGKSSLLSRFVDRLLSQRAEEPNVSSTGKAKKRGEQDEVQRYLANRGKGDVVLYLSGRAAFELDSKFTAREVLVEAVGQKAGIRSRAFTGLDDLAAAIDASAAKDDDASRKVWVILDALNEAPQFTDLVKELDHFLPAVEKYPWLRLVVSLRSGAYHALVKRRSDWAMQGSEVFANEKYLYRFEVPNRGGAEGQDRDVPYLELRPFRIEDEGPKAYLQRQQARPERACALPYERLSAELKTLLLSPLHVHVFHETYAGNDLAPSDVDEDGLLEAYLDRWRDELPLLDEKLPQIGRLMYERRSPEIPAEVADGWVSTWRNACGGGASWVSKLDPVEELVSASLLLRTVSEGRGAGQSIAGLVFSHQKLCEVVLYRELMRQIRPRTEPTGDELLAWARQAAGPELGEHDDFAELIAAIGRVGTGLLLRGRGEALGAVLALDDEGARKRILGNAVYEAGRKAYGEEAERDLSAALEGMAKAVGEEKERAQRFLLGLKDPGNLLVTTGCSRAAAIVHEARVKVAEDRAKLFEGDAAAMDNVGQSFLDAGHAVQSLGRSSESYTLFDKSRAIRQELVDLDPKNTDFRASLGISLWAMAEMEGTAGHVDAARTLFEQSRDIQQALTDLDPRNTDFSLSLSNSLSYLARVENDVGKVDEARTLFEQSCGICRSLVDFEPNNARFRRSFAICLTDLARMEEEVGNADRARTLFEHSRDIAQSLVDLDPENTDFRAELGTASTDLGRFHWKAGSVDDARQLFETSRDVAQGLVSLDAHSLYNRLLLSVSLSDLALLRQEVGHVNEALHLFKQSLALRESLASSDQMNTSFRANLGIALLYLARMEREVGHVAEARRCCERSLDIAQGLVDLSPRSTDYRTNVHLSLTDLARMEQDVGNVDEARKLFEESLAISQSLVDRDPRNASFREGLCTSLTELGRLHKSAGRVDEARQLFEKCRDIAQSLVDLEPQNTFFRTSLGVSLTDLGRMALAEGKLVEAGEFFCSSLDIDLSLVSLDPKNESFRRNRDASLADLRILGASLTHVARVAHAAGNVDESRKLFEQSRDIRQSLVDLDPKNTDFRASLGVSLTDLAVLDLAGGAAGAQAAASIRAASLLADSRDIRRALLQQASSDRAARVDLCQSLALLLLVARLEGDAEGAAGHQLELFEVGSPLVSPPTLDAILEATCFGEMATRRPNVAQVIEELRRSLAAESRSASE